MAGDASVLDARAGLPAVPRLLVRSAPRAVTRAASAARAAGARGVDDHE